MSSQAQVLSCCHSSRCCPQPHSTTFTKIAHPAFHSAYYPTVEFKFQCFKLNFAKRSATTDPEDHRQLGCRPLPSSIQSMSWVQRPQQPRNAGRMGSHEEEGDPPPNL